MGVAQASRSLHRASGFPALYLDWGLVGMLYTVCIPAWGTAVGTGRYPWNREKKLDRWTERRFEEPERVVAW